MLRQLDGKGVAGRDDWMFAESGAGLILDLGAGIEARLDDYMRSKIEYGTSEDPRDEVAAPLDAVIVTGVGVRPSTISDDGLAPPRTLGERATRIMR